jgi:hypothetical protein
MDPRQILIGTWVSDKRKTLKHWHQYHLWPLARRRRFAAMFGKLRLEYTADQIFSWFDGGDKQTEPYTVVTADWHSVVVRLREWTLDEEETAEDVFRQLIFERSNGVDYYWIALGANSECFRKVEEATKRH